MQRTVKIYSSAVIHAVSSGLYHRQYYLRGVRFWEWELGIAQHIDSPTQVLPGLVSLYMLHECYSWTHTYSHKPLMNIKVTIWNHQADSPLYVWAWCLIWWFASLQKSMVIHDTECPYWPGVVKQHKPNRPPTSQIILPVVCMPAHSANARYQVPLDGGLCNIVYHK